VGNRAVPSGSSRGPNCCGLPTGTWRAWCFRNNQEAPVLCAIEISKELKRHPDFRCEWAFIAARLTNHRSECAANIAGAGITLPAHHGLRVMPATFCCPSMWRMIWRQYPRWRSLLHDLGDMRSETRRACSRGKSLHRRSGQFEVPEKFKRPDVGAALPPQRKRLRSRPKMGDDRRGCRPDCNGFSCVETNANQFQPCSDKSIAVLHV